MHLASSQCQVCDFATIDRATCGFEQIAIRSLHPGVRLCVFAAAAVCHQKPSDSPNSFLRLTLCGAAREKKHTSHIRSLTIEEHEIAIKNWEKNAQIVSLRMLLCAQNVHIFLTHEARPWMLVAFAWQIQLQLLVLWTEKFFEWPCAAAAQLYNTSWEFSMLELHSWKIICCIFFVDSSSLLACTLPALAVVRAVEIANVMRESIGFFLKFFSWTKKKISARRAGGQSTSTERERSAHCLWISISQIELAASSREQLNYYTCVEMHWQFTSLSALAA